MKAIKTYKDYQGVVASGLTDLNLVNTVSKPMTPTNLKPSNLSKVMAFVNNDAENCVQGLQLHALYNLIQRTGDTIQGGRELNGLKCILLPNGLYLTMIHKPVGKDFFPCMTRCYLLMECITEPTEGQKQALQLYYKYKSEYYNPMEQLEQNLMKFLKDEQKVCDLLDYVKSEINR